MQAFLSVLVNIIALLTAANTLAFARPLVKRDVPYGVGIHACEAPGTLALTYDDGPYVYTSDLLNILDSYNAKATFFVTGSNLDKGSIDDPSLPWADIIRRMIADGHQVASHTWSHADLSTLDEDGRRAEMIRNEVALKNIIGKWSTYMRPPYSSCNSDCMNTMRELRYHIIYFDLDTQDYLHTTPETNGESKEVIKEILAQARQNNYLSILHDIHEQTVYSLTPYFLKEAKEKGYRFVTVGECLGDSESWYRSDSR